MADGVHQEQALLRGGVPGAEHRVGAVVAVDVRHPEPLVAEDLHAPDRRRHRADAPRHLPERRVLVVAVEIGSRERSGVGHDVHVERLLVHEGVRRRLGGLVGGEVGGVDRLALALREHRAEAAERRNR